eukprot:403366900
MELSSQPRVQNSSDVPASDLSHTLIQGVVDRYKGMEVINLDSLASTEEEFEQQIKFNMSHWINEGIRSVQIQFAPPKCHLMNVAVRHGFQFHHASPKGYVLMCLWLDKKTPCKIPAYSDHYVGVGGAIINDKNEILMIQEVRSPEPRPWKLPGGFMNPGETIKQACEREVYEETGIRSEFVGMLGIREQLQVKYGCTDLYIVCLLKLKQRATDDSEESKQVNIYENDQIDIQDKGEVYDARWIPIEELSTNEDGCKYRMFQNAYQFISGLHQQYINYKETIERAQANTSGSEQLPKLEDFIKNISLTYSEFQPKSTVSAKYPSIGANDTWKYYRPAAFDNHIQKL